MYGRPSTIYGRFRRWSRRGILPRILQTLTQLNPVVFQTVENAATKAYHANGCRSKARLFR